MMGDIAAEHADRFDEVCECDEGPPAIHEKLTRSYRLRFVATGKTHQYREAFRSRAWRWDESRQLWVNENEDSAYHCCISSMARLPGITITCEGLATEEEND